MALHIRNARRPSGAHAATPSMPRLYCARCGHSLKYRVAERGDWFGIEPTTTRCPRCGSPVLSDDETVTVHPKAR